MENWIKKRDRKSNSCFSHNTKNWIEVGRLLTFVNDSERANDNTVGGERYINYES